MCRKKCFGPFFHKIFIQSYQEGCNAPHIRKLAVLNEYFYFWGIIYENFLVRDPKNWENVGIIFKIFPFMNDIQLQNYF